MKLSNKLRQYNAVPFKAIEIGEKFVFGSDVEGYTSIGVCEKVSARKYKYTSTVGNNGTPVELYAMVGSINAVVVKLNKEGDPDRCCENVVSVRD